jgi:hypothetical protein
MGSTTEVMLRLAVAVSGGLAASATCTVKLKFPPAVGDPEIDPSPFTLSPGGRVPPVKVQLYGVIPPDACSIALYAVPTVAPASDAVVIAVGGTTVIDPEADFVPSATDVAVTFTEILVVTAPGAV